MQGKIVWQQGSTNPENASSLVFLSEWWSDLANKKVAFVQRLIPESGEMGEVNWEPQRFDEVFELKTPEIRGITLYWRKRDSERERNTTPYELVLDTYRQQLYLFPQSQKQLVIRVGLLETFYQQIEMTDPQLDYSLSGQNHILTLRDSQQQLEVKVTLSPNNLSELRQQLPLN